jgi:hypothetical protein
MRLIICLTNTSKFSPAKQGDFVWSDAHNCHVWQGRELTPEEFHSVADGVLQAPDHLYWVRPTVRVVASEEAEEPDVTPEEAAALQQELEEELEEQPMDRPFTTNPTSHERTNQP